MPMYEYACNDCGYNDTLLEKISAAKHKKCPECGKARAFERLLSAPSFHLKGTGWYVTDFRNDANSKADANGSKTASEGNTDTAKSDSKTDNKTTTDSKTDGKASADKDNKAKKVDADKAKKSGTAAAI